jgi:hypothetical protein
MIHEGRNTPLLSIGPWKAIIEGQDEIASIAELIPEAAWSYRPPEPGQCLVVPVLQDLVTAVDSHKQPTRDATFVQKLLIDFYGPRLVSISALWEFMNIEAFWPGGLFALQNGSTTEHGVSWEEIAQEIVPWKFEQVNPTVNLNEIGGLDLDGVI